MATEHTLVCGGVPRRSVPRAWRESEALGLRLGRGRRDVRLHLAHLQQGLCATLPAVAADLVELAAYVYAADQAVTRGGRQEFEYGEKFRRHFRYVLPVRCVDLWQRPDVAAALTGVLGFLTDDDYTFAFVPHPNPVPLGNYLYHSDLAMGPAGTVEEVMLFSGGLDSLAGAVQEVIQSQRTVALVSHRSNNKTYARQSDLAAAVARQLIDPRKRPLHVAVEVSKGKRLGKCFLQRARSFLFAAVAAVVGRAFGLARVRFYENGVTSLNLPLSAQTLGGRASRTTHPQTLAGFRRLFSLLFEQDFAVENPFQWKTKAEVLDRLKAAGQAALAAASSSCVQTWHRTLQHPHCGRCSQCVDRRISALAAGYTDQEDPPDGYTSDVLTGPRDGPDLTLVERYHGVAQATVRVPDAGKYLETYPELAAALPYLELPAEQAMAALYSLGHRHAQRVLDALAAAVSRQASPLVRGDHDHNCLLRLALGCRDLPRAAGTGNGSTSPSAPRPKAINSVTLHRKTFALNGPGGQICALGNTLEFSLVERLWKQPGHYVNVDDLRTDVWDDPRVQKNTIQRVVSNLRRQLREAGLHHLLTISSQKDHYCLQPAA
jgi:7-cyano-7-deazaguanine synthase in queuosine biosynthesis